MNLLTKCFPYGNAALKNPSHGLFKFYIKRRFCKTKCYSTINDASNQRGFNVKELEIPMPYGKLTAKAWGSETGHPVLAFHGWLDNCGTFDKLMPLLSNQLYIVAVDAPGHGMSSHKPPGCIYTHKDAILDYRRALDFLGWKQCYLIGHSMGAGIALLFSSLFSDVVLKTVALDKAKPNSVPQTAFPQVISNTLDEALKLEKKLSRVPPVYPYEAAIARLIEGMHNEITVEGAKVLLNRGSRPSMCGKGIVFTRDLRCRLIEHISLRSHELVNQYLSAVKCELLLIMANNTHPNYQSDAPADIERALEIYKSNSKKFVLEHVEGNHFVHLNNPERIAPLINKFLID